MYKIRFNNVLIYMVVKQAKMNTISDWDLISFVTSSKIRFRVLTNLNRGKNTPTIVSKELNNHISSVSRTLRELLDKELVNCLTDRRSKFKYYEISSKGKELLRKISQETKVVSD